MKLEAFMSILEQSSRLLEPFKWEIYGSELKNGHQLLLTMPKKPWGIDGRPWRDSYPWVAWYAFKFEGKFRCLERI